MSECLKSPALKIDGLHHILSDPGRSDQFEIVLDQPLCVNSGNLVAILGPSGCGKTTLLTILGLLRKPRRVDSFMISEPAPSQNASELVHHDIAAHWIDNRQSDIESLRRRCIGFALQSGELISSLTVRENIAVPLRLNGAKSAQTRKRVDNLIKAFELDSGKENNDTKSSKIKKRFGLSNARVNKLSGGQYQRVVLARAIAHSPRLTLVDEPTAALNRKLAEKALNQMRLSLLSGEMPGAIMMITHDEKLAERFADVTVRMEPEEGGSVGRVVDISSNQR